MIKFTYEGSPKKLSKAVAESYSPGYYTFKKLLDNKDVKVNGARVKDDVTLYGGEKIIVYTPPDLIVEEKTAEIPIIYEDKNILIVNKPAGLITAGEGATAENLLKKRGYSVCAVHRLDRNTGGLTVFALNDIAYKELFKAFKEGSVEKFYHARIKGEPKKKQDDMTAYLVKDADNSKVYVYDEFRLNAEKIRTAYRVIESGEYPLLEVRLFTGKTHQIRAHLAHIGHPVAGDGKYGAITGTPYKTLQLQAGRIIFRFPEKSPLFYLNSREYKI